VSLEHRRSQDMSDLRVHHTGSSALQLHRHAHERVNERVECETGCAVKFTSLSNDQALISSNKSTLETNFGIFAFSVTAVISPLDSSASCENVPACAHMVLTLWTCLTLTHIYIQEYLVIQGRSGPMHWSVAANIVTM